MKKIALVILCLMFLCFDTFSQVPKVDSILKKAFVSLQNKDQASFRELFPEYKQLRNIMDQALGNVKDSTINRKLREKFSEINSIIYDSLLKESISNSFTSIYLDAFNRAMDWNSVKLVDLSYKEKTSLVVGYKVIEGIMNLKSGDREFVILFTDIIWSDTNKDWVGIRLKKLQEKEEYRQKSETISKEENLEIGKMEVIDDKIAPPPPPPPPPVKKQDAKVKKKNTTKNPH